jgi:hypothetical protein
MGFIDGGDIARRYAGGVEFGVMDDLRLTWIRVSDAALNGCDPNVRRGSDYLGIFERHRCDIVEVARRKSDRGQFEPDGTILVRTGDLNN